MAMRELTAAPSIGEARDRELLKGAHSYVYYEAQEGPLAAHFFLPPNHDPEGALSPCILFLHGGLWDTPMPTQFIPHCHHFAARGAVAVTAEYRVFNKHRTNPLEAIQDARMIIGFLKQNAKLIGIDPERLIVAGAGSGAHLALCMAVHPDPPVSPDNQPLVPSAIACFSSIVDTSPKGVGADRFPSTKEAKKLSPLANVPRKGLPPCILFHGKQDRVAPFERVAKFAKSYGRKGNRCDLVDYEAAGHTFFNYNTNEQLYELTLQALDLFLVELAFLSPAPLTEV